MTLDSSQIVFFILYIIDCIMVNSYKKLSMKRKRCSSHFSLKFYFFYFFTENMLNVLLPFRFSKFFFRVAFCLLVIFEIQHAAQKTVERKRRKEIFKANFQVGNLCLVRILHQRYLFSAGDKQRPLSTALIKSPSIYIYLSFQLA